ncbi:MAG: hypothetical protein QOD57_1709 [Actinomycetota bacterium]|jgi:hypothetical protein|nr:hypothetical protein [Actinomycetota bacterium]MDQ1497748.1 hypothetical protein [Actinomycetota bacterium]MDQ1503982.1 hypothetical protein [Actinomycetota bacterium]
MGTQSDPHFGEQSDQQPHMGETEEPDGPASKSKSTATGTAAETGTDVDDAKKAGMRPTGSGGSAPPSQTR